MEGIPSRFPSPDRISHEMSPPNKEGKEEEDIESLRSQWTHLYASHLPALALARDPAQNHWPVHLDHCFARIILDNAVGKDKPWTQAIKSPAVRNMAVDQLRDALELGERVANGSADLVELDGRSLRLRGKKEKKGKRAGGKDGVEVEVEGDRNRKVDDGSISKYFKPTPDDDSPPRLKRMKREDDGEDGLKDERHTPVSSSSPSPSKRAKKEEESNHEPKDAGPTKSQDQAHDPDMFTSSDQDPNWAIQKRQHIPQTEFKSCGVVPGAKKWRAQSPRC